MTEKRQAVSLITTIRNEADSVDAFLDSLLGQTRPPDEIVLLDGGSTDGTVEAIQSRIDVCQQPVEKGLEPVAHPPPGVQGTPAEGLSACDAQAGGWATSSTGCQALRLLIERGANIARGRNLAIAAAQGPIIAATDAGCRLAPDWLDRLTQPLLEDPGLDVAGGFYDIDARTRFDRVSGLLTLPGQLAPVDPETFLPSARSIAFRKSAWEGAGGFPEWLYTAEDTLFDLKLKALGCRFAFVPGAVVHWRPYGTLRRFARAFYRYALGSGRTATHAAGYRYTTRHHLVTALLVALGCLRWWGWIALGAWLLFYVAATILPTARAVGRKAGGIRSVLLAMALIEVRRLAGMAGYWIGCAQRHLRPARYKRLQRQYMRSQRL